MDEGFRFSLVSAVELLSTASRHSQFVPMLHFPHSTAVFVSTLSTQAHEPVEVQFPQPVASGDAPGWLAEADESGGDTICGMENEAVELCCTGALFARLPRGV